MADPSNLAPIIIKKKKVIAGGGHHGGAWKVAYADFVTAMMAFFMLMWLLNATTEKQRKGIADYFNPTIPVNRISGGGEGMFGGESVFSEDAMPQNGTGGADKSPSIERQAAGSTGVDVSDLAEQAKGDRDVFNDVQNLLSGNSGESSVADDLLEHILPRVTDEGLIVEIFDLPDEPLFRDDSTEPALVLNKLITLITEIFSITRNQLAINGHTRSYAVTLKNNPGWEMSIKRADVVRGLFGAAGFEAKRIQRVAGWSDRRLVTVNPMSVRNNRLEIILLRSSQMDTGK